MKLSHRISLLVGAMVVLTCLIMSVLILNRTDKLLVEGQVMELERDARIQAVRFGSCLDELQGDTLFLAGTPPIQGMIRSQYAGGVDPQDGSSRRLWMERLTEIFTHMLESKPDYLQIRFIGVEDGGRELIRVDRLASGEVSVVLAEQLQRKGDASYFVAASAMADGQVYLSPIELNREHGVVSEPHQSVIRAGAPVYDAEGRLYGVLVVNVDMERELTQLASLTSPGHQTYVVNSSGDFIEHPDASKTFALDLGTAPGGLAAFPELGPGFKRLEGDATPQDLALVRDDLLIGARIVPLLNGQSQRALAFIVTGREADSTHVTTEVIEQLVAVMVALLVLSVGIGAWLARRISAPILALTEAVSNAGDEGGEFRMPEGLVGEAADLGSAFESSYSELEMQRSELEASNRELAQFAYVASHDLQEPLRTINSFVELLDKQYAAEMDETAHTYMNFISDACTRMSRLIHGLLQYSRLGADKALGEVDCAEVLREIQVDLGTRLKETGAELEIGPMPKIEGHPTLLRLLFQNLLVNALKFSRPGVTPRIVVTWSNSDQFQSFTVMDNGIGIAPEHRERIFLIFQRLHSREAYEGSGIGLAQCKKIVQMHGGTIRVGEGLSGGASFTFDIRSPKL